MSARTRTSSPAEQKLLDELVQLRIRLAVGDELSGPERAAMFARLTELEDAARGAGLLHEAPPAAAVVPGPAAQPDPSAPIEPE